MEKLRVAINGFGRIGRNVARLILATPELELVAINDLENLEAMSYLFKYDSVHGRAPFTVEAGKAAIVADGKPIPYFREKDPRNLPWDSLKIDVALEATGFFKTYDLASAHLKAGAKKVILTAPPSDDSMPTVVLGVNDFLLQEDYRIVSNASCTTNSAASLIQLLDKNFGLESCYITTVHSYTTDQKLQDAPHKDLRRARAAAQSIVPTTTGAAKALTKIFPHLQMVLGGCGIRVPVPDGSLTDITCVVKSQTDAAAINTMVKNSAEGSLKGIMEYTEEPIVSSDIIGNPHSCIFDSQLTSVIGKMVKTVTWYDNEIGYSSRLIDMLKLWA